MAKCGKLATGGNNNNNMYLATCPFVHQVDDITVFIAWGEREREKRPRSSETWRPLVLFLFGKALHVKTLN
ncbi:hypothetical protein EYF80_036540 [Liparis tanakae]|uniref:Uncharacterized protein n=1 Tax=Liparis tanakae TaxID=230148 RepID=A0A4Z2GIS2_9TELE|nr:hypothetical protein EYF80_036540 [Liparis tanakae]